MSGDKTGDDVGLGTMDPPARSLAQAMRLPAHRTTCTVPSPACRMVSMRWPIHPGFRVQGSSSEFRVRAEFRG